MKNNQNIKIIFALLASLFLFGCTTNKNDLEFDFSTIKKTNKIKASKNKDKEKDATDSKLFVQELVPLKNKQQIISNTKFGKKDPFSKGEIKANKLSSDFKLTGFLNTKTKKYAFVSYFDNEGPISEGFIGEKNTNLLPKGAKVISVNPKNKLLIISYENKKLIFEL